MEELYAVYSSGSGFEDEVSYDSETHEYSFILSRDVRLCGIGYQSQPEIKSYDIQIVDDQNTIVLDEQLSFSSDNTEYQAVASVMLDAGREYTIRRTCNAYNSISDVIGRVLRIPNGITLPVINGDLTITKVNFYGNGNPPSNAIPFIDLAVE